MNSIIIINYNQYYSIIITFGIKRLGGLFFICGLTAGILIYHFNHQKEKNDKINKNFKFQCHCNNCSSDTKIVFCEYYLGAFKHVSKTSLRHEFIYTFCLMQATCLWIIISIIQIKRQKEKREKKNEAKICT